MKTEVKAKACGQCVHWNHTKGEKGECRRHAPQSVVFKVDGEVQFESRFPVTAKDDWCGDFEKK